MILLWNCRSEGSGYYTRVTDLHWILNSGICSWWFPEMRSAVRWDTWARSLQFRSGSSDSNSVGILACFNTSWSIKQSPAPESRKLRWREFWDQRSVPGSMTSLFLSLLLLSYGVLVQGLAQLQVFLTLGTMGSLMLVDSTRRQLKITVETAEWTQGRDLKDLALCLSLRQLSRQMASEIKAWRFAAALTHLSGSWLIPLQKPPGVKCCYSHSQLRICRTE